MMQPPDRLSKTSISRIIGIALGSFPLVPLVLALGVVGDANAQSMFPNDPWSVELIEPEFEERRPYKKSRKRARRFVDFGRFVPLPVRNPKALDEEIMAQRRAATSLIDTSAIETSAIESSSGSGLKKNKPKPAPLQLPKSKLARDYCVALKDIAKNARLDWQKKDLEEVKMEVQKKTEELKKKIVELEGWFDRRQAIVTDYEKRLKHIYKQMQPDNAANQLGAMKAEIAKQILLQLAPGEASAILDEMEPNKAAALTSLIATEARNLAMQSKAIKKIAGDTQ